MKQKTTFRIRQRGSPPLLYRLCRMLAPSARRAEDVKIEFQTGQAMEAIRAALLVALCRSFQVRRSEFGGPGTYGYVVERDYEAPDLEACDLVCIIGVHDRILHCDDTRDSQGRLIVPERALRRLQDFGQLKHWVILAEETRQMLEQGGFCGLRFRQVVVQAEHEECPGAPYWELETSVTLPKLANTNRLMCYGMGPNGKVEPFSGDYSRMVFINDPPYALGEIHYNGGDLEALGRFDVGETFERLWIPRRSLVISQALYKALRSREIPVVVWPVRIDPDRRNAGKVVSHELILHLAI